MIYDFVEESQRIHVGNYALPRVNPVKAPVGLGSSVVNCRIIIEDIEQRQPMSAPHFIIVEVMGWGNLDAACAELGVNIVVGDYRYFTIA